MELRTAEGLDSGAPDREDLGLPGGTATLRQVGDESGEKDGGFLEGDEESGVRMHSDCEGRGVESDVVSAHSGGSRCSPPPGHMSAGARCRLRMRWLTCTCIGIISTGTGSGFMLDEHLVANM